MAANFSPVIQNRAQWMAGMLGDAVTPLSRQLLNPAGMNSNEIMRELWASWEGDNMPMSEFFLRALTVRGEYIRNLLPIETYEDAISKYGLRAKGDLVTFDTWNFSSAVQPDQSRRHPSRKAEDSREQHSRGFRGGGGGFVVPLDWLENETTQRHFAAKVEQMNRNIYLTWTFRVLQTLMFEGLEMYGRRLQKLLPLSHEQFSMRLDELVGRTFAMNKNGTSFSGIEARVVNQGETRDVHYDTVLVPPNAVSALLLQRAPMQLYWMRGDDTLLAQKQARQLAPEGNRTPHYGLNVFESREFPMVNGAASEDPLSSQCMVSQRFVMLPTSVTNGFADYRSCYRDIEVPDGENRVWARLTLRSALNACGMFAPRSYNRGGYDLTELGGDLLRVLCRRPDTNDDAAQRRIQNEMSSAAERSRAAGVSGTLSGTCSTMFPLVSPENAHTPTDFMPECANAFDMFRNAGIGRDVVSYLCAMAPSKFQEFLEALEVTDEELDEHARDAHYSTTQTSHSQALNRDLDGGRFSNAAPLVSPFVDFPFAQQKEAKQAAHEQKIKNLLATLEKGGKAVPAGAASYRAAGAESEKVAHTKFSRTLMEALIKGYEKNQSETTLLKISVEDAFKGGEKHVFPICTNAANNETLEYVIPYTNPLVSAVPTSSELADALRKDPYWVEFVRLEREEKDRAVASYKCVQLMEFDEQKPIDSGISDKFWKEVGDVKNSIRDMTRTMTRQAVKRNSQAIVSRVRTDFIMLLLGRGTDPTGQIVATPMLSDENGTVWLQMLTPLAIIGLNTDNTITPRQRDSIKAFAMHIVDHSNPSAQPDQFMTTLAQVSKYEGKVSMQVTIVDNFVRGKDASSAMYSAEKAVLAGTGHGKRASQPHHKQNPAGLDALFKRQKCTHVFFDALIRCDVPFPLSFILFRMHIRVQVSSAIFMVAGPKTGVVVTKDGFLNFTRRTADFALDVSTHFRTATFITNPDNLELVPHAMAKRYLGGAGTTLYDPNTDTEHVLQQARVKDIFVMAVPYAWQPSAVWTDITGTMNATIYNGDSRGHALNATQYSTCHLYTAKWGFAHNTAAHIFSAQAMGGLLHNPTLALQATQRVHSGDTSSVLTRMIEGHDPMGRRCEPIDYQILNGTTAAMGTGMEDNIPRKQRQQGY
jgi:hypothetical protein